MGPERCEPSVLCAATFCFGSDKERETAVFILLVHFVCRLRDERGEQEREGEGEEDWERMGSEWQRVSDSCGWLSRAGGFGAAAAIIPREKSGDGEDEKEGGGLTVAIVGGCSATTCISLMRRAWNGDASIPRDTASPAPVPCSRPAAICFSSSEDLRAGSSASTMCSACRSRVQHHHSCNCICVYMA